MNFFPQFHIMFCVSMMTAIALAGEIVGTMEVLSPKIMTPSSQKIDKTKTGFD